MAKRNNGLDDPTLRSYALAGIDAEIGRLNALRARLNGGVIPIEYVPNVSAAKPRRVRKPMTAAERRAVSKRMKAMWAAKRASGKPGRKATP